MNEIKKGQLVSLKVGSHEERGTVAGVMGNYATVIMKDLGKQITTSVDDLTPIEIKRQRKQKEVEYSGHKGDEMEAFRESLNISKKKFYVDICKIPSGSYTKMIYSDNITMPMWDKLVKGKAFIESLDDNEIEKFQTKPSLCVIPGFKRGCEESKKEPDKERMDLIDKLQAESKLNEIKDKQEESEGAEMEYMKPKTWIEAYKELIKSLSMAETFEFYKQCAVDAKRFDEMLEEKFNEIKEAII